MANSNIQITKASKFWSLIKENDVCAALFNHRTHRIYYNWVHRPDWSNLPVNQFIELGQDAFYKKLEKIEA